MLCRAGARALRRRSTPRSPRPGPAGLDQSEKPRTTGYSISGSSSTGPNECRALMDRFPTLPDLRMPSLLRFGGHPSSGLSSWQGWLGITPALTYGPRCGLLWPWKANEAAPVSCSPGGSPGSAGTTRIARIFCGTSFFDGRCFANSTPLASVGSRWRRGWDSCSAWRSSRLLLA